MKKVVFIILLSFLALSPFFVAAAITPGKIPTNSDLGMGSSPSPITEPDRFLTVMTDIAKVVYYTFFVAAFIFIILAAFNYLTGGDEPEKIKTAKKQLTYAAVAIAIALVAVGASTIIYNFLIP